MNAKIRKRKKGRKNISNNGKGSEGGDFGNGSVPTTNHAEGNGGLYEPRLSKRGFSIVSLLVAGVFIVVTATLATINLWTLTAVGVVVSSIGLASVIPPASPVGQVLVRLWPVNRSVEAFFVFFQSSMVRVVILLTIAITALMLSYFALIDIVLLLMSVLFFMLIFSILELIWDVGRGTDSQGSSIFFQAFVALSLLVIILFGLARIGYSALSTTAIEKAYSNVKIKMVDQDAEMPSSFLVEVDDFLTMTNTVTSYHDLFVDYYRMRISVLQLAQIYGEFGEPIGIWERRDTNLAMSPQKIAEDKFKQRWEGFQSKLPENSIRRSLEKESVERDLAREGRKYYFLPAVYQPKFLATMLLDSNLNNLSSISVLTRLALYTAVEGTIDRARTIVATIFLLIAVMGCVQFSRWLVTLWLRYNPERIMPHTQFTVLMSVSSLFIAIIAIVLNMNLG